jgi:heptosyltransferase-2
VAHALARYARALGPLGVVVEGTPRVEAGVEAERWAEDWLRGWSAGEEIIAFCPGARHATKRWPEEHWVTLHRGLRTRQARLLYLSHAAERAGLPALRAAVEADPGARWCTEPLPRLAAVLSHCAAAVTQDSGLMHLAAARGVRVVALFGSTSPALGFAPAGDRHIVLCRNERCQPCTLHGRERCPKGHFDCMRRLTPDHVLESLTRMQVPRA